MPQNKKPVLTPAQIKDASKALEVLFASEYVDKKALYKANFIRGMFFSLGSIVGTAVILGLLLWMLSISENIPLVDRISRNLKNSIEERK